ncbi:MAG: redoxin domain-containing protein [Chloroflexi bacterium]|nr:redoxin domain-containing protein [Chloroflexota bacterium]
MSEFRDAAPQIRAYGAELFGISVESDRAHRAFAESEGIDFPLLSDFNREAVVAYGVQHAEWRGMRGMSKRAVFVLAPDGSIRYKWVTDDPSRAPHIPDVLDCLSELQSTSTPESRPSD